MVGEEELRHGRRSASLEMCWDAAVDAPLALLAFTLRYDTVFLGNGNGTVSSCYHV